MILEELEFNDPDLGERCGLLADRYEVYAIEVPGCRHHRLSVSIDFRAGNPPSAMVHGAVPAGRACQTARALATRHRNLDNPSWE